MSRFRLSQLIAPALFVVTAYLVVAADQTVGASAAQKDKKDKDKKDKDEKEGKEWKEGPGKAAKDLRKVYDEITDLSQSPPAGKEATRVLDHTVRCYREAVKSYSLEPRRAAELTAAAKDGARGLQDLRRALARTVPGLPEPPAEFDRPVGGPGRKGPPPWNAGERAEPGPWSEALDQLALARERLTLTDTGAPVTGPSRDVLDAAKTVYGQARNAYEAGDYRKAAGLARAAEAWSHIPEHLVWAKVEPSGPPPLAPEPKQKGVPPPPPAIKE